MDIGDFLVLAIILYGFFGVRKKKNQEPGPAEIDEPKFEIPPIKGSPRMETGSEVVVLPTEGPDAVIILPDSAQAKYQEYLLQRTERSKQQLPDQEMKKGNDKVMRKQTDIHSDVLLNAVAYSQILQPPKAYQYMATKSCRGDWQNNK